MAEKSKKIYIDFQGGSHGNYLEFVCNRFLADIPTASALPFNHYKAAHNKQYLAEQVFICNHFTTYGISLANETVISIHIHPDDLLPLQCISLLRAGDRDINPCSLETDIYHKLCNPDYQHVLDNLKDRFFNDRDMINGYYAIADPSWPRIDSVQDYYALPQHIRDECEQQHGFRMLTLDKDNPNCPREILIEFFQIGFSNPAEHGFIKAQEMKIHTKCDVYKFPFGSLYNEHYFKREISCLSDFLQMPFDSDNKDFIHLHREFLQRQPYKDSKTHCDHLIDRLLQNPELGIPELDVVQEAYVRAGLAKRKVLNVSI